MCVGEGEGVSVGWVIVGVYACMCLLWSGYGSVYNIFQLGPSVYDMIGAKVKPFGMQSQGNTYYKCKQNTQRSEETKQAEFEYE